MKTNSNSRGKFFQLFWAAALLNLSPSFTQAATISWGTAPANELFQSDGTRLDASFSFEIGYFDNVGGNTTTPFVPTSTNLNEWSTYWRPWDRASTAEGFDPNKGYVARSNEFQNTSTATVASAYGQSFVIPTNAQAYLWVFDSKAVEPGSEWALITNRAGDAGVGPDWKFPDPPELGFPSFPDWSVDTAGTAVLGGYLSARGPGDYSASPTSYDIQTSAIPEPGSAVLILMCGIAIQIARKRQRR